MTDHGDGIVVRRAVRADAGGLVACGAALFAEDAGTRDPSGNARWPAEHALTLRAEL
ncbi:hypothetical protein [Streptomyces sp. NPDC001889]